MKKFVSTLILALASTSLLMANVLVEFPANFKATSVKVTHHKVSECIEVCSGTHYATNFTETVPVSLGTACIFLTEDEPARYSIDLPNGESAIFYASPDDELVINIACLDPIVYSIKGSEMAEGWSEFELQARPLLIGLKALASFDNPCPEQIAEHNDELAMMVGKYIDARPEADSALAVLLYLRGNHFMQQFSRISPELKTSFLYPVALSRYYAELANTRVPLDSDAILAEE